MAAEQEKKQILIAEDEPKIARVLIDYLEAFGYTTVWLENGNDVVPVVKQHPPNLILLDIMMPGKDGMAVCRELRAFSNVPIIMVTARVEEVDRLLGLELGADDYICKPFSPREVLARIKAVLRRTERVGQAPATDENELFKVDESRHAISINDQDLDLTKNEFALLKTFIRHPGMVFSRDQLLENLYDDFRVVSDRTIDTHVKNVRKKISLVLPDKDVIVSVYGVGYKMEL